ncbi:MAG: HAD-IB family hydrolase, partial [Acidimicrobiales bacterium]
MAGRTSGKGPREQSDGGGLRFLDPGTDARNRINADPVAEVLSGPKGPRIGAFFDLDGTVVAGYSAAVFAEDQLLRGRTKPFGLVRAALDLPGLALRAFESGAMHAASFRLLSGVKEEGLRDTGERLFEQRLAARVYPEARELIEAHLSLGHTVALCSSASHYQADPIARELGVEHVLCSELEVRDGVITGVLLKNRWGAGKAEAAVDFATQHDLDLDKSWFYANGIEDLPLLEGVGNPRPTNPDRPLTRVADDRNWTALRFTSRRRPRPPDAMRTLAALGGVGPAFLVALPPAMAKRDGRQWVNRSVELWSDWVLAASDVSLNVTDAPNLWAQRPAVFIYNHQSNFDPLIVLNMVRRDLTGVAKAELSRNPAMNALLRLGGAVFVDRDDTAQAVGALRSITTKLAEGLSILVAPEGTRSATGRLLPFKKGAFRIAMAGGVPLVPIVIRNSADALP